jgi:anti-sigma B factor antagonist
MKIEIRIDRSVRILDLHGRLVLGPPVELLADTVQRLLADGHMHIMLNLRGVPYIDSAGIGELAACKKRAIERQGEIKIHWQRGRYHLAIETVIHLMFPDALFEDEKLALSSFAPPGGPAARTTRTS